MEQTVGGRFEILHEAGAGAMGKVYRARDITNDTPVALKILNDMSEHTMRRFSREVAALAQLNHPGVVGYVAHGRTSSHQAFLAMEWLEGMSLEDRLAAGALPIADSLVLARSVATALGAAHARGIVHRDIKPANIFLVGGDSSRAKLLDFGLVRDLDATFALTNTGDLLGTPLFMAPEQASSDPTVDARVDVYALGAVLYNCVTGRAPLLATNIVALLAKIVLEEPPAASSLRPETPAVVDDLLMRLLAKRRDDRPLDGGAAAQAIAGALEGLANVAGPTRRKSPTVLPTREQRVVTVLLARHAKAPQAALDATLGSFGGAAQLADGSTLVVFDGPETPGALASRAANYALGLRAPDGAVALATGRALLSGPTPMGEVIERAAEALAHARGQVRICPETSGLLEGRFEVAHDERGAVLVSEGAGGLDSVRTLLGKPTRCIGRDRELSAIEGYYAEVVAESVARAVLVVADAGVGKSRLAREVEQRLARHDEVPALLLMRCESVTQHSPFAAAASALRRSSGFTEQPPEVRDFLGELLGVKHPDPPEYLRAARENPALLFDRIRGAWTTWLAAACAHRPLLLLVEDLHWCDDSSMLLIDAALGALADERFMVLALARPEVRDRRPWAKHRPHELPLDALSRRAAERLVREALGPAAVDSVVADIVARAAGNALFLEELVRASAHQQSGEVPLGVIGTVQRRLDTLTPNARAVLRAASIFGEQFVQASVAALVAHDLDVATALQQLVTEELVAPHGEHGFAFRHALVRDAAYALLAPEDRALGHALAARLLEREALQDPAVIALHYELGGRFDDAAAWYARAAERALDHNDLVGALGHAAKAQTWLTDAERQGAMDLVIAEAEFWRGQLPEARVAAERAIERLRPSSASWFEAAGLIITASGQRGHNDVVERWLTRAMSLEPEADAISAFVLCLSRGASQLAWERNDIARAALARVDSIAGGELSPIATARLAFARAYDQLNEGRLDVGIEGLHHVAEIYARVGLARDALQITMLAHVLSAYCGHLETSGPAIVRCLAEAERLEARYLADWSRWSLAIVMLVKGDRDANRELAQVSHILEGQPLFRDVTATFRAWSAFTTGDDAELARVVAEHEGKTTYERFRAALAGFSAYVKLVSGSVDEARAAAWAALSALGHARVSLADGGYVGFSPALATLVRSNDPEAATAVAEHMSRIDAIAAKLRDDAAREGFKQRVPWNRHVLDLKAQLQAKE